jgi:hypothetical protein
MDTQRFRETVATKHLQIAEMGKRNFFLEEPDIADQWSENWARPGLWGFRAGDRPVLPGGRLPPCFMLTVS